MVGCEHRSQPVGALLVTRTLLSRSNMPVERLRRSELRELLVSTGIELLTERGVSLGLDQVTYTAVFARVRPCRRADGSAYRSRVGV
jgi:hypothetical protein